MRGSVVCSLHITVSSELEEEWEAALRVCVKEKSKGLFTTAGESEADLELAGLKSGSPAPLEDMTRVFTQLIPKSLFNTASVSLSVYIQTCAQSVSLDHCSTLIGTTYQ